MPKVGGKHFAYTKAGKAEAKKYAAETGQSVKSSAYKMKGFPTHAGTSPAKQMKNPGKDAAFDKLMRTTEWMPGPPEPPPSKPKKFKVKVGKGQGSKRTGKYIDKYGERDFSPHNIAARKTEGTIAQQEALRKKKSPAKKHDGTKSSTTHYSDGTPKPKREIAFSERHKKELLSEGFTPKDADAMIKSGATTGKTDRPDPTYEGTDYYGPKGVTRKKAEEIKAYKDKIHRLSKKYKKTPKEIKKILKQPRTH